VCPDTVPLDAGTPAVESPTMTGGRILAEMLKLYEVGPMFGMGGFQLLPFYDAVHELGLQHHLINDERAGAFAADAYARITGRPGICDGTMGPGAVNLLTGLVESLNAGIPLVALCGLGNRRHSGKNMTQEGHQTEMLRPGAKELLRIESPQRIPEMVRRAFTVATSGRPGPVVLEVPEDVCHAQLRLPREDFYADLSTAQIPARRYRPAENDVIQASLVLSRAQRPVILAGGGVHLSRAYESLQRISEEYNIPVAHTMSGKGSIPCIHPLSVGLFGRYSRIANDLIEASDCLLVIGCKLGEVSTNRYSLIPKGVPIIHLEIDPEEIGRTTTADVALVGDAELGLRDLVSALSQTDWQQAPAREYAREVAARMSAWRRESQPRFNSADRPINVARLVHELNRVMPSESVLVADGGFASHWTALLYDTKQAGRTYLANRGFASIGYGLPGTLGAYLGASKESAIVGVTGDAGLNMMIGELETARRVQASFTLVVLNNAASGYVKALQHAMFEGRYQSADLYELNYARLASEMGSVGIRVVSPEELPQALERGIQERDRPTVIDVIVTRDPSQMLPGVDKRAHLRTKGITAD
jgi:acetolactate synthase-1/2/3 large subunit